MNGVKYKLNVGESEIESILSLRGGSEFSKPSTLSNQDDQKQGRSRLMTENKRKKKINIKVNADDVKSMQPMENHSTMSGFNFENTLNINIRKKDEESKNPKPPVLQSNSFETLKNSGANPITDQE